MLSVEGKILEAIRKRPEVKEILERALKLEESMKPDDLGFEWYEVQAATSLLNKLVVDGTLKITLKTRSSTHYRLQDARATKTALQLVGEAQKIEEEPFVVPYDLFDDVVGYDDIKEVFLKALEVGKVHFLLKGPPASAKTLFLLCLEGLPRSRYVLGSRMSKAGLTEYLITYKPKVLLLDEFDKLNRPGDYGVVLSLCETGRVTEMIYGKTRDEQLDTIVFACCNRVKGIPEEVLSRFQPLKFEPYTRTQFINIVENVLKRRGMKEDLALYIAKAVWDGLESHDPRQAIRIARLAKTRKEVDRLLDIIKKYS